MYKSWVKPTILLFVFYVSYLFFFILFFFWLPSLTFKFIVFNIWFFPLSANYPYLLYYYSQFSSVQLLSHVRLFATPWIAACQASLSITNAQSLFKLMSIESVMPSSHLILCHPLLLLSPIPPSIRWLLKNLWFHLQVITICLQVIYYITYNLTPLYLFLLNFLYIIL